MTDSPITRRHAVAALAGAGAAGLVAHGRAHGIEEVRYYHHLGLYCVLALSLFSWQDNNNSIQGWY